MDTTGMGTSGGPEAGAGRRAPTAAERLFDAALRWWRQRQTEAALMRCSDHVLADIGIARDHIPLVARGLDPAAVPSRRRPAARLAGSARPDRRPARGRAASASRHRELMDELGTAASRSRR